MLESQMILAGSRYRTER